jgi:hypothetical protein
VFSDETPWAAGCSRVVTSTVVFATVLYPERSAKAATSTRNTAASSRIQMRARNVTNGRLLVAR